MLSAIFCKFEVSKLPINHRNSRMISKFQKISPYTFNEKLFQIIDKEWFLITAGQPSSMNTMTASWGGFGILWNKPVCFIFVRPTRFTYNFLEENERFTMSFFSKEYKKTLSFLGTISGKNLDKIGESGLTLVSIDNLSFAFEESRLIFDCKKIYYNDLLPQNFLDSEIGLNYKANDYHRMYIGEIVNIFEKLIV